MPGSSPRPLRGHPARPNVESMSEHPSEHGGTVRYDDGQVRLDADGIRVAHYYFPLGRPRVVAWSDLRGYQLHEMTAWSGRLRVWGTHRLDWWYPLDLGRFRKTRAIVLDVPGTHPAVTPDDVAAVCEILDEHLAG